MQQKYFVTLFVLYLIIYSSCAFAQSNQLENLGDINSISQPDQSKWQQLKTNVNFSEADINTRIDYNQYPILNSSNVVQLEGWKGEEVNAQMAVSSKKDINSLNVSISDLTSASGKVISSEACKAGYIYYVIADDSKGVCQKGDKIYKEIIVPDIIDFHSSNSFVKSFTNRPVFIKIQIPSNAEAGIYKGKITASWNENSKSEDIVLKVSNNEMPSAANKKFFLELWQYPLTEADFYKVKPWSQEHFNAMKPAMNKLKEAGEDVITASFFWDQFNPSARNADDMFIKVSKESSGAYTYDFTNFDKWVSYMMDIGISKQITVFGMATLNYRMYYYDEDSNKVTYFQQGINGTQYRQFWTSYLKAFEQHLKEKNWFDITTLGFSEKNPDVAIPLIKLIKSLDKNWKISYSGKYFPEIQNDIYDYSLISNQKIPDSTLAQRRNKGYITTFYTSCWERFPNTFVMSDPTDATWLGWNAANRKMDGYLRYAYDFWTLKILNDVRTTVASGDNFLIYPNGYSSVRFEMLKDGIEDFEKIRIKEDKINLLSKSPSSLNSMLTQFDFQKVNSNINRSTQINNARALLNN